MAADVQSRPILHHGSIGPASADRPLHTYHSDKDASYMLPNDSEEHIRLNEQAMLLSALMNNRVLHAPLTRTESRKLVDIGCGTGVITHLMADLLPAAECIGVDISMVTNTRSEHANVHLYQGNIMTQLPGDWKPIDSSTKLPMDLECFDCAFSRLLILGMTHWPRYIRTVFNLLAPNGWAEIHDLDWAYFDGHGNNISDGWEWLNILRQRCGEKKIDFRCGAKTSQWMQNVGFEDIQVFKYAWPYGGDSETEPMLRRFSLWLTQSQPEMIHHMIKRTMDGDGNDNADDTLVARMQKEMRRDLTPRKGMHMCFYVTIGRKPA